MSNRAIYAILVIVALAAVAGFWLMLKSDGPDPEPTTSTQGSASSGFTGPGHGPATAPGRPSLPVTTGSGSGGDLPDRVKEYAANGAIIRDHRTGTHATFEGGSDAQPPNMQKLDPAMTKSIADKVRDVMHTCVAAMPEGARGETSRLEGSINIAIKDKRVLVNKASLNLRGVNGDAAEATRTCIEQKALAVTQPADVADLASYDITLSFSLL